MKKIPLTQGKFAIVDDEDYDYLMQWKWQYHSMGYAMRTEYYGMTDGKRKTSMIMMHRAIMKTPKGKQTDHINGNKLDNRKCNLRICVASLNGGNQIKRFGSSKYKGVYWSKSRGKWHVQITKDRKCYFLGYFVSEDEAGKAYNKRAKEYFGEFARLNRVIL